jgi:hypothetical protein
MVVRTSIVVQTPNAVFKVPSLIVLSLNDVFIAQDLGSSSFHRSPTADSAVLTGTPSIREDASMMVSVDLAMSGCILFEIAMAIIKFS